MCRWLLLLICLPVLSRAQKQERKVYTATPDYYGIISAYQKLEKQSPCFKLFSYGTTDAGKPLHLFVICKDQVFEPEQIRKKNLRVLLINNGIHPGEPEGIDASIELVHTYVKHPDLMPAHTVVCIIPVLNVDGCLNRGKFSRANQNGPEEYGFRGNARNLDLNRDFVKADSKNVQTFMAIFQQWKPDVFIDTHTSNGADYSYVMTLIATQRDKLDSSLSGFMTEKMLPAMYRNMKEKGYDMIPYVDSKEETPDDGIVDFLETPRFSTGYAAQFNTIAFVSESHMWKPYNDRVWATYELLKHLAEITDRHADELGKLRKETDERAINQKKFPLNWTLDTMRWDTVLFKGYAASYVTSEVTGKQRIFYDRNKSYEKNIRFYDHYKPTVSVDRPQAYVIPQAWGEVAERLKLNGVTMNRIGSDTLIKGKVYYITDYETSKKPYEGHYVHSKVTLREETQEVRFFKGDYLVWMNQPANRYLTEVLEPRCDDSFFAWGFFDAILQQKEWFSDYIFDEKAKEILEKDPSLKKEFEEKKKSDKDFEASHWGQLIYIYQHSEYYEKSHNRYPVMRIER